MADFNERLKELREEHGLSKLDLGKVIDNGTSPHTMRKYEADGLSSKINNIIDLATHFDVTTDYLLGVSDTKKVDLSNVSSEDLLDEVKKRLLVK